MPVNPTGYNNDLKFFINFAEKNVAHGNSKAIANVDVEHGLNGRRVTSISSSKTDAVYSALTRSNSDKDANDKARNYFRESVIKMFGEYKDIPKTVIKAMELDDYEKGRPLTARRILKVKAAIDLYIADLAFSETFTDYYDKLDQDEVKLAGEIFIENANGMSKKAACMFARYVFNLDLSCTKDSLAVLKEKAKRMAEEIANWKEFDFSDPKLQEPRKVFEKEVKSYIESKVKQDDLFCTEQGLENISKQMYADCDRSDITINDQHINSEIGKEKIIKAFKEAIPSAKAQRLISWAMNQSLSSPFIYASAGDKIVMHDGSEPVDVRNLQGGKLIVGRDKDKHYGALSAAKDIKYALKVTQNGTLATLTNTIDNLLMVGDRIESVGQGFGSTKQSIKVVIDMSDPENPYIKKVDIAQTLSASDPK